jgi:ElaB/YqjD/DUF883 family membrane-anchored ribosome-binding protein
MTETSAIHEFMTDLQTLDAEVEAILHAPQLLTKEQLRNLACILQDYLPQGVAYGADFDLVAEIGQQLTAIKAMRRKVMTDNGVPMEGISARDLKEVATASNTILQTLIKTHEKIMSYERQRAIEKAAAAAVRAMPQEFQDQYFEHLERELSAIA